MGSESIAHEVEWAIDSEAMRASKIQLVGQKCGEWKNFS